MYFTAPSTKDAVFRHDCCGHGLVAIVMDSLAVRLSHHATRKGQVVAVMSAVYDNNVIKHIFCFQPFDFADDIFAVGHPFFTCF